MKSLVSFLSLASCAYALWPQPVYISTGDTVLFVDENVQFHWYELGGESAGSVADQNSDQQSFVFTSNSNAHPHDKHNWRLKKRYTELKQYTELLHTDETGHGTQGRVSNDEIIEYAIITAWRTIITNSFYPWKFHPRAWDEPSPEGSACLSEITVRLLSTTEPHASTVDESYLLNVGEDGKATIAANSSIGIARGLTSFTQLFYKHSNRGDAYTPFAPVTLRDAPKFQHRGINLDVSRNWFPVSAIKRQINAIAYNKMNRLHLHVTDSQSWPLEIPALPELSAKGAYRPDLVYTPEDFKHIQRYAALHGVEVVTEIDMPGHTSSIHHSYPNLVAAFNRQPDWGTYCAEPPCGTLKLNSTDVYDFLETLFDDLLPRISPYSGFFHTGGDEVNKNSYNLDDTVRSNESDVLRPLMQKFIDRNHDQVRASGLTPMVWEEMLLDWNLTLGEDVIVQSWQSDEAVAKIVSKGHKALVGNYKFWYLDCGKGQWLDFDPSISADAWPYYDYCAPFHNWRLAYSVDPYSGIPEDKHHLVIGGEAHMWAEQTDPVNVDRMIWPRGSAVAEVLWSGPKDAEGKNRSQIDASPRLSEMRERLVAKGIGAEPIQMPYCTMNGTQCALGHGY